MDVLAKLRLLLEERGWSEYKLARQCGLSDSTIANIFRRNTLPTIATLERICAGFGITLAQFFAEGELVEMTPELQALFEAWQPADPRAEGGCLGRSRAYHQS